MHEITCRPTLDRTVFTDPEAARELFNQKDSWLCVRVDTVQPRVTLEVLFAAPELPLGCGNRLPDTVGCCQHQVSLRTT